ncbi:MAG: hypothetical protein NVS3B16_24530 [Vulcanimicrobiaceae bacterium]
MGHDKLDDSAERASRDGDPPSDEEIAIRRYLLYFMLPLWIVPGIADWYLHRRTKIEATSGTHESLTHQLMMGAIGVPIRCGLLFDINALVLVIMMGGYVVHEGVSYWDVRYAGKRRDVPAIEQHTHSFLEMLPFMGASFAVCLKPRQFAAIFGRGDEPPRWRFEAKRPALTARYVATILAAVTVAVALPYAEEFVRCYRVDRTLLPHDEPAA